MSKTTTATDSSYLDEPSREIQPTTAPITTLSSPAAQALSLTHPIILTSYFYLRFGALVTSPVSTLLIDLFPIAAIQCGCGIVCLPFSRRDATSENGQSNKTSKGKPSRTKSTRRDYEADIGTKVSNAVLSLLLTAITTLPIFILLVLFGAPLTTHHPQTLLCAAHFSLLAVFPLFYTYGLDKQVWWEVGGAMLPFDSVWGTTIGSALGAWLGAVPIPLDWDREWQKWPVTIVAGIYAGALMGNFTGRYLLHGKRIRFRALVEDDKIDMKKKS